MKRVKCLLATCRTKATGWTSVCPKMTGVDTVMASEKYSCCWIKTIVNPFYVLNDMNASFVAWHREVSFLAFPFRFRPEVEPASHAAGSTLACRPCCSWACQSEMVIPHSFSTYSDRLIPGVCSILPGKSN